MSARHDVLRAAAFAPLIVLVVLAPVTAAQEDARVVMVGMDTTAETRVEETATLSWRLVSNDPARAYRILPEIEADDPSDWTLVVEPAEGVLPPGGRLTVYVNATAGADPDPRELTFTFNVLATNGTDALVRLSDQGTLRAYGSNLVLGAWANPLPPPLDNTWGAFLLNVLAWLAISLVVMWFINPTMRALTIRTKSEVDDRLIRILKLPVFLVLFTWGIKQSLEIFRLPTWVFRTLDRLWMVVLVFAIVYVAYRLWQEVVLIVGRRISKRTETTVDDRLLPVFEKIGGLIILLIGMFYVVASFGIDLTLFAAGGVLVSMVIAFAAQDTLSNFFSGIHLMVDQPFKEGDDIILDTGEVATVSKIGLRSTHLYHVANHETIIVPNNLLATNRIVNLLKPDNRYKVRVDIGVAYGSDVQRVKEILLDIARSHPLALKDKEHEAFVRFQNFGASSLDFSIHLWIDNVYARWAVASDVREMIDERFAAAGIEIPFPQQTVWFGREEKERAGNGNGGSGSGGSGGRAGASILQHRQVRRTEASAVRQQGTTSETGGDPGGGGEGGEGGEP